MHSNHNSSSDIQGVKWAIELNLRRITPKDINPSVIPSSQYGDYTIRLNDNIPEFRVNGPKFVRWLKSNKATYASLQTIARRKATQPQQQNLNLD